MEHLSHRVHADDGFPPATICGSTAGSNIRRRSQQRWHGREPLVRERYRRGALPPHLPQVPAGPPAQWALAWRCACPVLAYLEQGILPCHTQHVTQIPAVPREGSWCVRHGVRGRLPAGRARYTALKPTTLGGERRASATNCTRRNGGIASQSLLVEPIA